MFSYHSFTLPIVATLVLSTTVAVANSVDREPVGQNLIILLIDGYGATLFNRTNAKLQHGAEILLQNGVQAEYMTPVFPTQSYPNWYSLVTGSIFFYVNTYDL